MRHRVLDQRRVGGYETRLDAVRQHGAVPVQDASARGAGSFTSASRLLPQLDQPRRRRPATRPPAARPAARRSSRTATAPARRRSAAAGCCWRAWAVPAATARTARLPAATASRRRSGGPAGRRLTGGPPGLGLRGDPAGLGLGCGPSWSIMAFLRTRRRLRAWCSGDRLGAAARDRSAPAADAVRPGRPGPAPARRLRGGCRGAGSALGLGGSSVAGRPRPRWGGRRRAPEAPGGTGRWCGRRAASGCAGRVRPWCGRAGCRPARHRCRRSSRFSLLVLPGAVRGEVTRRTAPGLSCPGAVCRRNAAT